MGAPDRREESEPDVPGSDSLELTPAEEPTDLAQLKPPDETRSRGEVYADQRQRTEGGWEPRPFEAPREELARFDPERAGLPAMSLEAADKYIAQHRAARPWLVMAGSASPEARRIIAAMDAGGGHGHIRHEGSLTEEASMRRVAYLEDPAQVDPWKRHLGMDGLRQNDAPHRCRSASTRVTDPDAFATVFARGVEHPKVREALDMPFDPNKVPRDIRVPIADLLGPDGHHYCTGWRLEPVDGSMKSARANRDKWLEATAAGGEPDVPEPQVRPVPTFEGGVMTFLFEPNHAENRYQVVTDFPRPTDQLRADDRPELRKEVSNVVLLGTTSGRPVRDAHRGRDNLPGSGKLPS